MAVVFLVGYGAVTLCAILFMGIALGTVHWLDTTHFDFGLFQKCTQKNTCVDNLGVKTGVDVYETIITPVRALCITAILLYAAGGLVMAHFVFLEKMKTESKLHGFLTLAICILAGTLAISGVIHYTKSYEEQFTDYLIDLFFDERSVGYSAYLAGTSGGLAVVGGILALLSVHIAAQRNY